MPKYYVQWEADPTHTPQKPKDRLDLWTMMTQWVIADIKAGIIADWGRCSGETGGYVITNDVTPQQLDNMTMKYTPAIKFLNRTVLSPQETLTTLNNLAKQLPP